MALFLPPLASLRLFEAAGRLGSFKKAAEELNLTPSAVSHGIVSLERALGVALFVRGTRSLSLTPEGAEYLPYVSEAFSLIAIGTRRLPGHGNSGQVSISCAPSVAARWLLPRLADFRRRWPEISVSVDTSHRQVGFPMEGFDFAIRMNRVALAPPSWTQLFRERWVPVCAPSLRDSVSSGGLAAMPLIHVASVSEDWQAWAEATGTEGLNLEGGIRMDTIHMALEAAKAGLGIALGRRPLADCDLEAGILVTAGPEVEATGSAYWLVCSDAVEHRAELRHFKRWLLAQAGLTP